MEARGHFRSDAAEESRLGAASSSPRRRVNPSVEVQVTIMERSEPRAARANELSVSNLVPQLRPRPDRRNTLNRTSIVEHVRSQFHETPGLCVTIPQAARLCGVSEEVCGRVLSELVEDGLLQKSGNFYGAFRAAFVGRLFLAPATVGIRSRSTVGS